MRAGRRLGVALAAVGVLAAACSGIGEGSSPAVLPEEALPEELVQQSTTTTSLRPDEAEDGAIYVLANVDEPDEALDACVVKVPIVDDPATRAEVRLQALIDFDPTENTTCGNFVTNRVPTDLGLIDVTITPGRTAVVNVATLEDIEGRSQRRAIAQIVFTLTDTSADGVGALGVQFLVDGEPSAVAVGDDETADAGATITRADFPGYATGTPSTTTATAPVVPPG